MEKYAAIQVAQKNFISVLKSFNLDEPIPFDLPEAFISEIPLEMKNEYLDLETSLILKEISSEAFLEGTRAISAALTVRIIRDRLVKKFSLK